MRTIEIKNGDKEFKIYVGNIKYMLGSNNEMKHQIKQLLKLFYNPVSSDYRDENDASPSVSIDGELLNLKRTSLVEIKDSFSLNEEGKLGSKSILTKYFEYKLQSNDYFETIGTIDILFQTLADELNEEDIIKAEFNPINPKMLIKLMKAYFDDDYQKDEYDLSIEELLIQQIRILRFIQDNELRVETYIVLVDTKSLTKNVINELKTLKRSIVIVLTDYYLESMKLEEISVIEDIMMDLSDSDSVYEQLGEQNGQILTYQEVNTIMENYISTKYEKKKVHLINDIKKFSL